MAIFRFTQKLQKEMGLRSAELVGIQEEVRLFEEWYAHLFFLDRKKQVVFVEPHTLFTL